MPERSRRANGALWLLNLLLAGAGILRAQTPVAINLATTTAPSAAQPGITVLTLTCSRLPSGTITPASLSLTLQVAPGSSGPNLTANVMAFSALPAGGGRITFQVTGGNVSTPTPYQVSVSGTTATGEVFVSSKPAALTINPPPAIISISPNSGLQGQSLSVLIAGQYTNYVQGATQANFGPGISVGGAAEGQFGPVTVTSATTATAQITIDPAAVPASQTLVVATGIQQASLPAGFTIIAPSLLSVNPASGQQGQVNEAVTITGQFTHFAQGASQVSFGSDITVNSVTATSATGITAVITVPPTATVGGHTVAVTTGAETVSLPNGFTVQPGIPVLTQINSNTGQQGQQGESVSLTGQYTHWTPGTTTVSFGAGITVANLTINSSTTATAILNVDSTAVVGTRNVTVSTGSEVVGIPNGFTVAPGTPVLTLVNPNSGQQGQQNLSVSLTGQYTHWVQGTTTANFGTGVTVVSLTINSATGATAVLNIDQTAATGLRNITLTTSSETVTLTNGFTVTPGTPVLTQANPNTGQQGQQSETVNLNGQYTHWAQGTTSATFGSGITVASFTVNTSTTATATLNIDPAVAIGLRNITVTTGLEVVSLTNGFTVNPGTPVVTQVNPNSGQQGQQNLPVNLLGQYTHWVQGTTTADFGAGVTVSSLTINSSTSATAVLNIDPAAATGARNVTVTSGAEVVALPSAFTVNPGTPVLTTINPNTGQQGQQNESVALTGQFTHWVQGTTTASFGAGITVTTLTINSGTTVTAVLNIDPSAAVGTRNPTLTTGTEVVTLTNGFTVNPGTPVLTQVNPNSGQQGLQNLTVSLLGQFTHWVQGTTTANFGAGITVGSLTINSPTTATAVLNIDPTAAIGTRSVTVTTGSEAAALPNGFSVLTGMPVILSVSPNSGQQAQVSGVVGSIFLTGHDPDFHAVEGGNGGGAADINRTAINFITNPAFNTYAAQGIHRFLYVTSSISAPGGHVDGTSGLTASGYVIGQDFDRADASTLVAALAQLGTAYNALVIASDFGGILTQSELDILNAHSTNIISFLNQGGGIYAMAETAPALSGLASSGFFGFLPFVVTSQPVDLAEVGNSLTPFGTSLGLVNSDINGNAFHNVFTSTGGLNIVDTDPAGEILSLAGRGGVAAGGVTSVIITGQFTHFAQGATQLDFGPEITVGTIAVTDATHLTAQLSIAATAAIGPRTVTVTTGTEVVQLANGFTVTPGTPVISQINPASGQQGQQNETVNLVGQFSHWVQGTTTATFGPGITVASLTVNAGTTATAILNIDPAATTGARNVTLTTGTEAVTLNSGFTVNPGTPVLTQVNPNNSQQGQQNLSVALTGQFTHWVQGTTSATFGPGITVTSVTVNSVTTATAVLNIDPASATGARAVTVTTGTEIVALQNAFSINEAPRLLSISPNLGQQALGGCPIDGTLTLTFDDIAVTGDTGATTTYLNTHGITFTAFTANTFPVIFDVIPYGPGESAAIPSSGSNVFEIPSPVGPAYTSYQLNFCTPLSSVSFTRTAIIDISGDPPWTASALNAQGQAVDSVSEGFLLGPPAQRYTLTGAGITALRIDARNQGTTFNSPALDDLTLVSEGLPSLPITITGEATHFTNSSVIDLGVGISAAGIVPIDATHLQAHLSIAPSATPGVRDLTVTTGGESAALTNAFTVTPAPELLSMNPGQGVQGQGPLPTTITGQNAHFTAASVISLGTGITATAVNAIDNNHLTAQISIAKDASDYAEVVLSDHPTAYYRLDESAGLISADSSGNGHDGTFQGNPILGAAGLIQDPDAAVKFNGQGPALSPSSFGSVVIPDSPSLNFVNHAFTLEAWVSGLSLTGDYFRRVFDKAGGYGLDMSADGVRFLGRPNSGLPDLELNRPFLPNSTYYVVATSDGTGNGTIYIDGRGIGSGPYQSGQPSGSAGYIGVATDGTFPWLGTLDEVAIYNYALSPQQISAHFAAGTAARTLTVSSGSEILTLRNAFAALPAAGLLSSLPNLSLQGQQNETLSLTGQFTHWAQGSTFVSIGPGVTVVALTVKSPSIATAIVNVDPTAAVGPRNITVTTGAEVVTLNNGFMINPAPPTLTQISPGSGPQGEQSESVSLTGQFTHWVQGATTATFGVGITVASLTVTSATTATAVLNIDPAATIGIRDVTVTTGSEAVTLNGGFTVTAVTPTLTFVNPVTGQQGQQNLVLTIGGQFTHFAQGTTSVSLGTGISINAVNVVSQVALTVQISITASAPIGPHTITITTGSEIVSLPAGFAVRLGGLLVEDPVNGNILSFDTTGAFISTFITQNQTGSFGYGPDGNLYVVNNSPSPTILRYNGQTGAFIDTFVSSSGNGGALQLTGLTFGPNGNLFVADWSARNVKEYDGTTGAFIKLFAVPGVPSTSWLNGQVITPQPSAPVFWTDGNLYLGEEDDVEEFNGTTGAFIKSFPSGPGLAAIEPTPITFGPDGNLYVGTSGPCCPETAGEILKYDPVTAALLGIFVPQGSGSLQAVAEIVFRPDGYAYVLSANTASQPSLFKILKYDASTGAYVGTFLSAGAGGLTGAGGFLFPPATPPGVLSPAISSLSPSTSQQGQQSVQVTINGQNTHFLQDVTQVAFGSDITVNSVTVTAATSLTANITVPPSANLGGHTVTVTTGSEVAALANGFTVTAPPVVVSAGPSQTTVQSWDLLVYDYVSSVTTLPNDDILRFDPETGNFLGEFVPSGEGGLSSGGGLAVGPDGNVYAGSSPLSEVQSTPLVLRFDGQTGAFINTFVNDTHGHHCYPLTFGPDGNLYCSDPGGDKSIHEYDGKTGAFIRIFGSPLTSPYGLVFGPDGNLYVADSTQVTKLDGKTGANLGAFVSGLTGVGDVVFGPDGHLYANNGSDINQYDSQTGALIKVFAPAGSGGRQAAGIIRFGQNGNLYVGEGIIFNGGSVYEYDGQTGAFIKVLVPYQTAGLTDVSGLAFRTTGTNTVTLAGSVVENGSSLPLTSLWTQVSGPGSVTFTNPSNPTTTAAFSTPGTYVLQLTASNGQVTSSAQTTVSFLRGHVSVAPYTVTQGQSSIAVTLTSHGIPFIAGTTQVSFGPGITVSSLAVNSATSATATLSIDPTAAPGWRAVTVQSAGATISEVNEFFVNASTPVLQSVAPNTALQGQQYLPVWIYAAGTHFLQGQTTVSFGPGVSLTPSPANLAVLVASPTTLEAIISVDAAAIVGSRDVTVTTGSEVVTLAGGFTITGPSIISVNPNSGQQGQQNVSVNLTGQFTHWAQGTTTASFGAGVTVASLSIISATNATAVLNIDPAATTGPRNVILTTGAEVVTLNNGFTVQSAPANILSVSPNAGSQGTFSLTSPAVMLGPILPYHGMANSPFNLMPFPYFHLDTFEENALTVPGVSASAGAVIPPGTDVDSVEGPGDLGHSFYSAGAPGITFTFDAKTLGHLPTHVGIVWTDGDVPKRTFKAFDSNNALVGTIMDSSGQFFSTGGDGNTANYRFFGAIDPSGISSIFINNDSGGIEVDDLQYGYQDPANPELTVIGQNTHFTNLSLIDLGPGIEVSNVVAEDASHLTAQLTIEASATTGPRTVTVTTGTEVVSMTNAFTVNLPTTLLSISPAIGFQGQTNLPVMITGQNTHFTSSSVIDLGTGITASNIVATDAMHMTAQLTIASSAAVAAARNLKVTSGSEVLTLTSPFTVQPASLLPIITLVSPSTAQQGRIGLAVTINGQNTHFAQGTTAASFGNGITVGSLIVNSTTAATATLIIDPAASTGARDISLSTGTEVVTLNNGFTVNPAIPMVTLVNPNTGQQGQQNLSVTLTGQFTNWVQGVTTASFGAGIAVTALSINSPTSATAVINVDPTASISGRTITVITGSETAALANGFRVLAVGNVCVPAPSGLIGWWPGDGNASDSVGGNNGILQGIVTFSQGEIGQAFNFDGTDAYVAVPNSSALNIRQNLTVTAWVNLTAITQPFPILVAKGAINGQYELFVNGFIGESSGLAPICFRINIGSDNPASASDISTRDACSSTKVTFGQFIFVAGTYDGTNMNIYVNGVLESSTPVSGGIAFDSRGLTIGFGDQSLFSSNPAANHALGLIDEVQVFGRALSSTELQGIWGAGYAGECKGIAVGPTITTVSPNSGPQGQGGPVSIVGQNTHFVQGTTVVDMGPGITVSSVTVTCPTCLTAQVAISGNAALGPRTVTVTTGSEVASLTGGFTVLRGIPILTSIVPAGGTQGQTVSVTITGQYTSWVQGTTQVSFGPGVTTNSVTVNSATSLTAQATIAANATLGVQTVTVTTGAEVETVPNVFTIATGVPLTQSAAPNSGQQAQTVPVTITGQFTHFAQNITTVDFGSGITVGPVTVASATSLSTQITIAENAATGPRTVTVTTGTEVASGPGAFTVNPGTIILSLNPGGAYPNQTVSVTITGQLTNFVQGTTQASFGPGIAVGGAAEGAFGPVTVTSATSATAQIVVDPSATPGPRTVQAKTNAELAPFTNGFSVVAPFIISSITPNSAQDGQQNVTVAVVGANTHFVQNSSVLDLGAGVSVASLTVSDATHLSAVINVAANAPPAVRDVAVTTGSEFALLKAGFTVIGPAVLSSITPNNAQQGQTNLAVTIVGQNTHFTSASTIDLGAGITFTGITATDSTHLSANLTVAANASTGFRNLTITTGTEVVSLPNGFGVNVGGVNQAPVITITSSWSDTLPNLLAITYGVTDDGLPVGGALTVAWSTVSGPGTATFQNQTMVCVSCPPSGISGPVNTTGSISVGFSQPGTYVLQISATDTQLTTTQNVTVTVTGTAPPPPTVTLNNVSEGMDVTSPIGVTGSVTSTALASWTLEYKMQQDTFFRTLATGTTPVTNAVLGTFDPTLLLNGIAEIQLRAVDTAGQTSIDGPISVVVSKNQKLGNFTVSFKDLDVPLPGLDIQLIRTYDSRNTAIGDFGVGWTLDVRDYRLQDNGQVGLNWQGTVSGSVLSSVYCIVPTTNHVVTVIASDGTVYKFQPTITAAGTSSNCQQLGPILEATVGFAQVSGPPASLSLVGTNIVVTQDPWPGPMGLLDENDLTPVDYSRYRMTFPDGRTIVVNRQTGLETYSDTNANTLTITPTAITHSSGVSIALVRDNLNRITTVTDPAGRTLTYAYDSTGNLATFTDAAGNVSTYTYDANHFLLNIADPRGIHPINNQFDSSGRLISSTDAFGNTINYTQDFADHAETVTDRLGNKTVNVYDADGNITQVTDPLGGVTKRTYDSQDNLLTEINSLGKTRTYTYDANNNRLTETDPLGNTTKYSYTSLNRVATITDPLNRVTTNSYDGNGNLLSTVDPAGNATSYTYDANGNRTSMTDALGNKTSYAYDAFGHLLTQTDPLGHTTTNTYDAVGNKLTETKTRTTASGTETLVTGYQYDGLNRLVKTTYPDGSTTQTTYNNIGKQSVTTDQLGRQSTYTYDAMGRLTQTTYPDATSESSTYDAEGDRLTSTDRAGRVTAYQYDALKRLVQTTYADGAATSTTYDAIGEVTQVTDARGNITNYAYDNAGRRTQVTDALNHVTAFVYDATGNQTSMTDANANQTQYQYDSLNRRTRVTYPDNTFDATAYDALGRTTSKTDQAGKVTQYQYDALGRLTRVTDALNQITTYGYDELGNRLSQTDANSHTTSFAYDKLGRRTKRTLPLGQFETSTYDAAGNLTSKIDFNGKTTTYAYDAVNRLLSKTPDLSFNQAPITFTYSATGQRLAMVDPSGTTTYTYDSRDRLLTKATPEGTLTYTYDAAGDLATIRSSNTNGTSVNYAYDALNRLATVIDNRLSSGTTTYSYDNVGNMAGYVYPNGVQTAYQYNTLNRLTNVSIAKSGTLASFAYTLAPAGNRTAVSELGGRQVNYSYDALYRLTGETIAGGSINGTIGYTYDAVGNRLTRPSTVAPVPPATYTYDTNDRLTTDTYDNDGNTTASSGNAYAYDFENHLQTENANAVTIVYDGDGNRVSKTAGGITTKYLVDDRNLTGYAQVEEEISAGTVQRVYTYGLNRISQSQASGTSFYVYDGHGNVRLLTDATGAVTDRYDYDAFGNIISQAGTTSNLYLYSGEQNDTELSSYYLRARQYAAKTGRFLTGDPWDGDPDTSTNLNRYLYALSNPVMGSDPSGTISLTEVVAETAIIGILSAIAPEPLGNAPESKSAWSDQDIVDFRTYISYSFVHYVGIPFDCSKLALTMLVNYAYDNRLAVHLKGLNGMPIDSMSGVYRNKSVFLAAVNNINADEIYDYDSNSNGKGTFNVANANNLQVGDLIMRHSLPPDRPHGHTRVFLKRTTMNGAPAALIIQGNLDKADNPIPVVAKVVPIPSGSSEYTIRWWNSSVFGQ